MDMNPLDKIKDGIEKQDWSLVCEGYNTMTGQNLLTPSKPLEVPFTDTTIQLFKSCMQQMIDEFEFVQEMTDKPDTEDHVVETCDVAQPEDDDEENIDFDEVTSAVDGVGLYGNRTVLITEKPTASSIEANEKRAAGRDEQKMHRPPPKTHEVKCSDCGNTFKTRMKAGGQFGQKCPGCLKSTSRSR